MSDEFKGAAGVALFGFAIAALAWLLPARSGGERSLTARQNPHQESSPDIPNAGDDRNPIRALGASPGTKLSKTRARRTHITEAESKQQAPISAHAAAPLDQRTVAPPSTSDTFDLHVAYRQGIGADAGAHVALRVVNGSDSICEGLRVHLVEGPDVIDMQKLPTGCTRHGVGEESLSCSLVDLAAGEQTTLMLPLLTREDAAPVLRVRLFAWLGGAATVRTAVCELGDGSD